MRSSCLISCYNYRNYVGEAVHSALEQTLPFDRIVVVDDGSTDGSANWLAQEFGHLPHVKIIRKQNGGQLSCFHAGLPELDGDAVFFLDADDRYPSEYHQTAAAVYRARPEIDCVIAARRFFGQPGRLRQHHTGPSRELGFSVAATLLDQQWIGGSTSCLSMRSSLLQQLLPYPHEPHWRTRADDVLVYGSSIMGSRKFYLAEAEIEYRLHEHNVFARRRLQAGQKLLHGLAVHQLLSWYAAQAERDVRRLSGLVHQEFRTKERPTWHEYRRYMRMAARGETTWGLRFRQWTQITRHMLNHGWRKPAMIPGIPWADAESGPSPTGDAPDRRAA
jgi:glycosyltransferase involved in cell wall biosynthesis